MSSGQGGKKSQRAAGQFVDFLSVLLMIFEDEKTMSLRIEKSLGKKLVNSIDLTAIVIGSGPPNKAKDLKGARALACSTTRVEQSFTIR